jgi:hypothetical protein
LKDVAVVLFLYENIRKHLDIFILRCARHGHGGYSEFLIKGSALMARTAGMELTAKITSVVSSNRTTANIGVATQRPSFFKEKLAPVKTALDRHDPTQELKDWVFFRVNFPVFFEDHLNCRNNQESAENVDDPGKIAWQGIPINRSTIGLP